MVAKYTESMIRMPKLKPLRLGLKRAAPKPDVTESEPPVAPAAELVKTAPAVNACMHTTGGDTPVGLAMDTIAIAMSPFFARRPTT
jgi:hypothetical protein